MRSQLAVRTAAFGIALLALNGCGPKPESAPSTDPVHTATKTPADPWVLGTTDPVASSPAYLSNGLIGVRVGRAGNGLDFDGKPLSFLMIDEYDQAGEEKILPLPSPLLVTVSVGNSLYNGGKEYDFLKSGGTPIDPRKGTGYSQTLDMRTGILRTEWTQRTAEAGNLKITCDTLVHPTRRVLGQRWTFVAEKAAPFSIRTLDYAGPNDPQQAIGKDSKTGTILTHSPKRVVSMNWRVDGGKAGALSEADGFRIQEGTFNPDQALTFERVLYFGDHSPKPTAATPKSSAELAALLQKAPVPPSYAQLESQSRAEWGKRWKTDIEIDGPVEDQQAVRSFIYALRSSIHPKAARAVSPFALSDPTYSGHVFWDADIWVFPALALIDPEAAKAIPDYRIAKAPAARENYERWIRAGRPTASGAMGASGIVPGVGLKYPWESSESGHETVPGPSQYEDHITGSVLFALNQAKSLGLASPEKVKSIAKQAALYYRNRAIKTSRGLEIQHTMSPDENHTGNNDLYTNILARNLVGKSEPFYLPKDASGLISYDQDAFRGYKQAAAVLSIYPLEDPVAEQQAEKMMEKFADKTIKNGPAMTDSVHAIIWARLGQKDRSYADWRKSWNDFTQNSLLAFSEKRNKPTTYFVTGAGGSLQTCLFGFLGFRIDSRIIPGTTWKTKLVGDSYLSVMPNLPPMWKSVKFKNFSVLGARYTLTVTPTSATVRLGE